MASHSRFFRLFSTASSAFGPSSSPLWWVKENAHFLALLGGMVGSAMWVGTATGSVKAQVFASAELMKAQVAASAELMKAQVAANAELMKASQEASAELMKASQEASAEQMKASQEANARMLDKSLAHLDETMLKLGQPPRNKEHIIADETFREYQVNADCVLHRVEGLVIGGVCARMCDL
jgi:hypothetical protein